MTCIAGLVHEGSIYIGGDSAGSSGWNMTRRTDAKVFRNGPYLMGFTTSFRMGQLLRYAFAAPIPDDDADLFRFMTTTFVDGVRACLKDGGFASKDKDQESGGQFIVGTRGRLFTIDNDYGVGEAIDPIAAVGCGAQIALGALYALGNDGDPAARLLKALQAAEQFSNGVGGPFTTLSDA